MTSTKTGSVITWLEGKPYWEQYLWKLHVEKGTVDNADIERSYKYLLEDSNVIKKTLARLPIIFPKLDLDGADTAKQPITLDKIENLKDVNAVDDQCVIEFGKKLTIVYGENGAGKSGIGRLLSNACYSRKIRKLLPNAKSDSSAVQKAKADFHIADSSGQRVVNYNFGDKHPELKSFAVFDHESALIHLNSQNNVEFVPSKIQVFDDVFASITVIEEKLANEKNKKCKANLTENIFPDITKVTEFLETLSYTTTDQKIDDELKFTQSDIDLLAKRKTSLAEKQKQDVSKQKKELNDDSNALVALKTTLDAKISILSVGEATRINKLIKEIADKKAIVDKLSVKNFDFAAFKHVGSPEWRALIVAAQKLYEKEKLSHEGSEPDHCLLCRQSLTDKEKSLFGEYWKFLRSTAESELTVARTTLGASITTLERVDSHWPTFSETEIAIKILTRDDPDGLRKIKTAFDALNALLLEWVKNMKEEVAVVYKDPEINLLPITNLVNQKTNAKTKLVDPTTEITTLSKEIVYLEQKKVSSSLIPKIKEYTEWLRWEHLVSKINLPIYRGNITKKKTEVMEELVMSKYVTIFNEETEKLDCDFGLEVASHGRDSKTVKSLKLKFAAGHSPSDILSEGEQTVSALADFLTEAKLDKNNFGIVFDDPVTSLDHLRKSTIAKRLVEEAKERQVIVLTHDIAFLLDLQLFAESETVDYTPVTIRKNGDRVGIIKNELPWLALNVKSRAGVLKNDLVRLKKLENGDQDEYRKEVKGWYELLREAWERTVEERLLNGVVQRFNHAVQTQRLAKIPVTPDLVKEVSDGMTEASKWVHDMAAGINPAVPKNAKLEADLKLLEDFLKKCNP